MTLLQSSVVILAMISSNKKLDHICTSMRGETLSFDEFNFSAHFSLSQ